MTGGRTAIGVACMPGYLHQYMTYSGPDLRFYLCQAKPQILNVPRCLRPSQEFKKGPVTMIDAYRHTYATVRVVQAAGL